MNVPTTRLHQQPLLLEPARATALDQLAKKLKMPKQELLREAVDDLLAMHNLGVRSLTVEILKDALRRSADLVVKLEELTQKQAVWQRKCYETKQAINDALAELGIENLI
jgi:hypothetical protein